MDKLDLMLCCNNPDNGMFEGYAEAVSLELACGESIELNGPRVKISEKAATTQGRYYEIIKIGRVSARKLGGATWVGNWCWDSVRLESERCRMVLNYLKRRGWSCECAPAEFYDRWQQPGDITPEEWPGLVNLEI